MSHSTGETKTLQGHRHATRPSRRRRQGDGPGDLRLGLSRWRALAHGKILRSPHAHARIKSIDTSAAEKLPGVLAVVTATDFPNLKDKIADLGEGSVNLAHLSANVLAHGKALYKGHAVAAVAATNPHVAEEALQADQGRLRAAARA